MIRKEWITPDEPEPMDNELERQLLIIELTSCILGHLVYGKPDKVIMERQKNLMMRAGVEVQAIKQQLEHLKKQR